MTVRQRARRTQQESDDRDWARRRDELLYRWRDKPEECRLYWLNEPGIPKALRDDPLRWKDLLAPPEVAAEVRAERGKLLAKRRAWLERHNIR